MDLVNATGKVSNPVRAAIYFGAKGIIPDIAGICVITGTTVERVVACATIEYVIAVIAGNGVIAIITKDGVIA